MAESNDQAPPDALSLEEFRAELEVFSGPLDLLLYLVRQEEVDIFEVPLALITDRYLAAVRTMEFLDVNVAADFLVVAATLMEIKSRTLLPPGELPEEEDEGDPGAELIRRLLEYKEYKEAAEELSERHKSQSGRFPRPRLAVGEEAAEPDVHLLEDLTTWDLMAAFAEVIEQTQLSHTVEVVPSDVPVTVYMEEVLGRLKASAGPMEFLDFFRMERSRSRIVGIFLALLELVRQHEILVKERTTPAGRAIEISIGRPTGD